MNRRAKVDLFQQIRRDYEFDSVTISGVPEAMELRRLVRQAHDARPPEHGKRKEKPPNFYAVRTLAQPARLSERQLPTDHGCAVSTHGYQSENGRKRLVSSPVRILRFG